MEVLEVVLTCPELLGICVKVVYPDGRSWPAISHEVSEAIWVFNINVREVVATLIVSLLFKTLVVDWIVRRF